MFSTIKSVEEYTNINLFDLYDSQSKRTQLVFKRLNGEQLPGGQSITDLTSQIDAGAESLAHIRRAQSIIEIFIGKDEIDIENPSDLLILNKMTAYQSAYMVDNEDTIYNQVAVTSQGQTDFLIAFDGKMSAPWMAPLAVIASRGLSFKKPRSIKTGKIFQWPTYLDWRKI